MLLSDKGAGKHPGSNMDRVKVQAKGEDGKPKRVVGNGLISRKVGSKKLMSTRGAGRTTSGRKRAKGRGNEVEDNEDFQRPKRTTKRIRSVETPGIPVTNGYFACLADTECPNGWCEQNEETDRWGTQAIPSDQWPSLEEATCHPVKTKHKERSLIWKIGVYRCL